MQLTLALADIMILLFIGLAVTDLLGYLIANEMHSKKDLERKAGRVQRLCFLLFVLLLIDFACIMGVVVTKWN